MEREKINPSVLETNIFYLVEGLLLLFLGGYVQSREIFSGLLITQYLLILAPTIIYLNIKGYSLKTVLKLNKISLKQAVLIPLIVIFSYPVAIFLNYLIMLLLSNFMELKPVPIPIPQNSKEFLFSLIIISITPGICEEVLFRGMVMSSYNKLGKKSAILISAVLFGIFHFNIQNLIGPAFLGVIFGYMVYRTGSIFTSMIAHGVNNAISLSMSYFLADKIQNIPVETEAISLSSGPLVTILSLIIGGAFAFVSGVVALNLYKALPKGEDIEILSLEDEYKSKFTHYIPIVLVLIAFVIFNYLAFLA